MNRRTLLAFALIFLVIFAFQEYSRREAMKRRATAQTEETMAARTTPDRQEPGTAAAEAELGGVAAPDEGDRGPAEVSPELPDDTDLSTVEAVLRPVTGGPEQQVEIATPLYVVTLAGRGARMVSWRGLEFDDHHGGLVELVPQDEAAAAYGMDAVSFNATDMELGRLLFETEAPPTIDLGSGTRRVTFRLRTAGDLEVRKTYTFDADSYEIKLDLELAAAGPQAATARSLLGLPRSARFGWNQGIASTEGNDRFETAAFRSFAKVGDQLEIKKRGGELKDIEKVTYTVSGPFRFAGIQNKYFTIAGLPAQDIADAPPATIMLSGDETRNVQTWAVEMPLRTGNTGSDAFASRRLSLYIGPQEADRLKAYGIGLEKTMDLGWALFRPLTEATLWIMDQMRRVIPNYGVVIILFSIFTKVVFYPLTRTSTQSMKKMQMLQPKVKAIQEKYKDNQEKQSKAMMELYKKEKVNPAAGCLPLLLQMPVFVALYQALAHTIALRNTPFVLWIDDLSQPDALFSLPFTVPFLGDTFNLLPLLMTATMVVQTRMTPTGQAQGQMAMMNTLLPVMMFFFFYQMPSGLVLYWLVNNVVTIYQTWRIHKTATPEVSTETS